MLKFIDKNDFLLPQSFTRVDDDTVSWVYDDGTAVHSGVIRKGFTRTTQVQNGTETVVIGQDDEGNDITEEQPVFETQTIDIYQALLDSGVTIEPAPLQPIIDNAIRTINAMRDEAVNSPIDYDGYQYQADDKSVMNIMGAILAGVSVDWITVDNQTVTLTETDLQQLGTAIANRKTALTYQARTYKDEVSALTDAQSIESYINSLSF